MIQSSQRTILGAATAAIFCGGLTAAVGAADLSVKAAAHRALIVEDAPTTVTVTLKVKPEESGSYELHQEFVNRYGEVTAGPVVKIDANDQWQHKVDVPVEYYGPSMYRAKLTKAGEQQVMAQAEQFLIRPIPVPRLSREQRAGSPMGICVHTNADWQALAAMGVHWARDYSWGWLGDGKNWPVAPNKTNFANVEPSADKAGITILPILQQAFRTPDKKFFIEDTDAITAAYKRFSTNVPQLKYWELDNEADLVHRDRNSADYKKWLESYFNYIKAAHKGLAEAGQGAKVVLNGEAGIHPDGAQLLIDKVGDHFAVINYHFYTGAVPPELAQEDMNTGAEDRPRTVSFLDSMRQINQVAKRAGKEAWLTEIGWSARSGAAVGDRLQSAYLERAYLLARWAGTDKVFWFWDRELPSGGRFSSMELIDYKGAGAKPAGAAMAAVSRFTALAEYAGSVDIGPDRWCLVFRRPEGGFLVAAWSVQGEYDLPGELAAATELFDMYGNPLRQKRLRAEPAYSVLGDIPAAWQKQLRVELLGPTIMNLYQGADARVEVRLAGDGEISFPALPAGMTAGAIQVNAQTHSATLQATPRLAPGSYALNVVARGEGWEKRFPLVLRVRPAVDVTASPFIGGEPVKVELQNLVPTDTEAKLSVSAGTVSPASVSLSGNGKATAEFTAPADETGAIALKVVLGNGATQEHWIRPRNLAVPRAGQITLDGDLSDWPAGGEVSGHALNLVGPLANFQPKLKVAWSPEGLYVASTIPVGEGFKSPARPDEFWEWTSVEMSVLAAPESQRDPARQHLFWFVPQQDASSGAWRVYAGEWLKAMPDGKKQTLEDDKRFRSAMRYDGQNLVMEVLVPNEVLGDAPKAGAEWPLTISAKSAVALSPRTVATWPAGQGGAVAGWGRIRFAE